jgi:holliday junction DNA helicase RuvB
MVVMGWNLNGNGRHGWVELGGVKAMGSGKLDKRRQPSHRPKHWTVCHVVREAVYQQSEAETSIEIPAPSENESSLRPRRMDEMVGQRDVIERLKIAIEAAQKRDEPLGHILFDGPPGLGKTTFATVIPTEMGTTVQMANGAGLRAPKDLLPYLTNLSEDSVLFIDEIHRIPKPVEEYLYTAMEDFRIDIILGDGVNARTLNYELKPFTLIGATTRAGMLSAPLRDRSDR